MWSVARITILGSCVAAGVAVAVGLAGHFTDWTAGAGAPASRRSVLKPPRANSFAALPTPAENRAPKVAPQVASQETSPKAREPQPAATVPPSAPTSHQAAFPAAPYYRHSSDAMSDKIDRLERVLQRVTDTSTQNQIQRLEQQLDELTNAKTAAAEASTATVQQDRFPAAQPVPVESVANHVPAVPGELKWREARDGEGDDRLQLNLRGQDLRELLEFLSAEAGLNILASESVTGTVTASLSDMDAKSAILAILRMKGFVARQDGRFLYVGTPADLERMNHLSDTVQMRIYRTNYVTAAEIQALIAPLLSTDGKVTVSSPAETTIPADTVKTGGDDFAGNEVIMVHDYERVLKEVDKLIAQVDQRPRQVMIEAMIVSVALDDSHSVGINFETFQGRNNLRLVSGTPLANLGQINVSNGGLQFGVLDGNVGAFIDALEGIGDTDVIAAPHLLCLNKQKAEILIGDQKGYLSTTQTETATTQTVEFLELGTQLRIRPFISSDGMVRLEVHPELSAGEVKLIGEFALPEKTTTQVTTNIMCRDGCTVVIGGLIREEHARTITQAAGLGNLPILGELFRNKKIENQRTELIVLLTPKIVQDPMMCEEGAVCRAAVSQRRAAVASRKISPIARHHYGRHYYRLAQSAWYAGNLPETHRYLDIALRMNPHDIMAKRLLGILHGGEGQWIPLEHELPSEAEDYIEQIEPLEPMEPQQPQSLPPTLPPAEPRPLQTSLNAAVGLPGSPNPVRPAPEPPTPDDAGHYRIHDLGAETSATIRRTSVVDLVPAFERPTQLENVREESP